MVSVLSGAGIPPLLIEMGNIMQISNAKVADTLARLERNRAHMSGSGCFKLGSSSQPAAVEPLVKIKQVFLNPHRLTDIEIERRRAAIEGCGRRLDILV
jgi:hypothetical protein